MPLPPELLERIRKNDPSLIKVDLSNEDLSVKDAQALADVLKKNTRVKKLVLSGLGVDSAKALAPALSNMTALRVLGLDANNLGADGAMVLAPALSNMTALEKLYLSENNLGADGATVLAPALSKMTALKELWLTYNNFGADGATALAPALSNMTALKKLFLNNNNLNADAAKALAPALSNMTVLDELVLTCNNLGADGAAALEPVLLEMTMLTELHIYKTQLSLKTIKNLQEIGTRNCLFPAYCLQQLEPLKKQILSLFGALGANDLSRTLPPELIFKIIPFPDAMPEAMCSPNFFLFMTEVLLSLAKKHPLPKVCAEELSNKLESHFGRWLQTGCVVLYNEFLETKAHQTAMTAAKRTATASSTAEKADGVSSMPASVTRMFVPPRPSASEKEAGGISPSSTTCLPIPVPASPTRKSV